jgi:hypothetical protein
MRTFLLGVFLVVGLLVSGCGGCSNGYSGPNGTCVAYGYPNQGYSPYQQYPGAYQPGYTPGYTSGYAPGYTPGYTGYPAGYPGYYPR